MEEIGQLLECPVCRELPRPGITGIGQCPTGHLICHNCTIQTNKTAPRCPYCRASPLTISNYHHFIFSVVNLFTSRRVYECAHEGCTYSCVGPEILHHERQCPLKPIPCHKFKCPFQAPISTFLNNEHDCLIPVAASSDPGNVWSFAIPLRELYNLDTNSAASSLDFKLRFLSNPQKTSQAYLGFRNKGEDVIIYVGWLGDKPENCSYRLHLSVNNQIGHIGGYFEGTFKLYNQPIDDDTDGFYLSKRKLTSWFFWLATYQNPNFVVDVLVEHFA